MSLVVSDMLRIKLRRAESDGILGTRRIPEKKKEDEYILSCEGCPGKPAIKVTGSAMLKVSLLRDLYADLKSEVFFAGCWRRNDGQS